MRSLLGLCWILVLGCAERTPDAGVAPVFLGPRAPLRFQTLPALVGPTPPSAAYLQAVQVWRTATTAYARHQAEAGPLFLETAGLLKSGPPAHQGAFRAARCAAYENAASAFGPEAEDQLRALPEQDPACRATLRRVMTSSTATATVADPGL